MRILYRMIVLQMPIYYFLFYSKTYSSLLSNDKEEEVILEEAILHQTGILPGVQSNKPRGFFHDIQDKIDQEPWQERCGRWATSNNNVFTRSKAAKSHKNATLVDNAPKKRRIFYGSLIADESWELFEILGAETYGIFEGVVFVESNRTQNFSPRTLRHNRHTQQKLQETFGTPRLEIRQFVNEDPKLKDLHREHTQRQEILRAWKDMGMGPEDVGYLADVDETFSRDLLRAIQVCPYVKPFDYESHRCLLNNGQVRAFTSVFEGSPECLTKKRSWHHPNMVIGACLEEVGNATVHPRAPRNGHKRKPGFGGTGHEAIGSKEYKKNYANITGDHYPLWSAGDVRSLGGGLHISNAGYHFHNWFPDFERTRNKYKTYGHPVKDAMTKPIQDISNDLKLMAYCLRNLTDAPTTQSQKHSPYGSQWNETQGYHRVKGGYKASPEHWPLPIYFNDEDYRQRKHEAVQAKLQEDQNKRLALLEPHMQEKESLEETLMEAKRQMWEHQQQGNLRKTRASQMQVDVLETELHNLLENSEPGKVE